MALPARPLGAGLSDAVRRALFGPPSLGGSDLGTLDLQRGRDHGLPDHASLRRALGLGPPEETPELEAARRAGGLGRSGGSVRSHAPPGLDALAGMHAEAAAAARLARRARGGEGGDGPPRGAPTVLGSLAETIILDQFRRTRDGDRFWYAHVAGAEEAADLETVAWLRRVVLRNLAGPASERDAEVYGEARSAMVV
jgi:hypothetical protein